MRERWINAVITIRVPLDVPVDASDEAKVDATVEASERPDVMEQHGATIGWELVEDGEPVDR